MFRGYEREHGLPHRFLSEVVLADPEHGAWSRLERGELTFAEFCDAFEAECAAPAARSTRTRAHGRGRAAGSTPRPEMVDGDRRDPTPRPEDRRAHQQLGADEPGDARARRRTTSATVFDVVVESAVEGLRKPDPRIYELVCERLDVAPTAAVFLDDLGANLKPARALGMTTIKVADPPTLAELSTCSAPLD